MTASTHDSHLSQVQSDELIPSWIEESPLTWLDEIGLDKELDRAAAAIREAIGEAGETYTDEQIRLALAAWLDRSIRHELAHATLMLTGGAEHFFSVLKDERAQTDEGMAPPSALEPGAHAQDNDQIF